MQRTSSHPGESSRTSSFFDVAAPVPPRKAPGRVLPMWDNTFPPAKPSDVKMRLIPTKPYLLGEGRFANVYLASYRKGKGKAGGVINEHGDGYVDGGWRLCAAKRMAPDRASQTMGLREAFFLRRLRSRHVIDLIATLEDDSERRGHGRSASLDTKAGVSISRMVLLLEHAPRGSVALLLKARAETVGEDMWRKWAHQTAEALTWIHSKGVIHADIKPGNLLVGCERCVADELTSNLDIRLGDFGSSLLHPAEPPFDGVGLGTLPYSAPELLDPTKAFSYPIDVYALGATLHFCITGVEPFRGMRAVELVHHARKGIIWEHEERHRKSLIGTPERREEVSFGSLWESWMKESSRSEINALLDEEDPPVSTPTLSRQTSVKTAVVIRGQEMEFRSGEEVPEEIRSILKRMLSPNAEERPLPAEIVHAI